MPVLPNTGIKIPEPGVTTNWGDNTPYGATDAGLNFSFTQVDNIFTAGGSGTSVGLQVGSGKTLLVGGTFRAASGSSVIMGADGASGTVAGNTIRAGNASGTDTAGGNLTIQGGNSTGNAAGGSILMQVAAAGPSSGTGSNTLRNVLRVESTNRVGVNTGGTAPAVTLDVGAGGSSGSATAQQGIRLNGSSAGAGTQGGSLLTIANNGTNTGAVGNYSAVMGGSTTYAADTTIASASTLRFFTGATIAGAIASNERLRLGTAGEIGLWDATLGTPAINNGASGQVLVSGGTGAAPAWKDTLSYLQYLAVPTAITTYVINSSVITSPFKQIQVIVNDISHNSSNSRNLQLSISGDNGFTYSSSITISNNITSSSSVSGVINIHNAALSSGSRLIQSSVSTENTTVFDVVDPTGSITGSINAIRLSWSSSQSFKAQGSVTVIGYN